MPKPSARSAVAVAHPHAVAATDLALLVLDAFTLERPEWSVGELAEALGVYRSRVHRAVSTLLSRGYLERGERGKLRLGLKLFELGSIVAAGMDLLRDAAHPLEALSRETQTSTWLIQRQGDELLDLLKFEPAIPLQVVRRVGTRNPLTFGVVGKLYLAYLPESDVARLLALQPLQPYTEQTITDPAEYRAELARTLARGYSITRDEIYPGVTALGAPVWNHRGELLAAIALSAPTVQVPEERVPQLVAALLGTAATISRAQGYAAPRQDYS